FIFGLLIATLLMLPTGLMLGRYAYKSIITIPKAMLVPTIALMTVIGSYAIHNNADDVTVMIVIGIVGWVLNRMGFAPSPIVLGIVLGQIAEQGFVQAYLIGNAQGGVLSMYFGRPISLGIIALALLTLFYPFIARMWRARRASATTTTAEAGHAE